MATIEIRRAGVDDVPAIAPLFDAYRQFYEMPADLALATRYIDARLRNDESVIFLAERAGTGALGFCQLYATFCSVAAAPIYVLYDLFVDAGGRKSGAGTALLQAAENHARENGFARLELSTARDNHTAQALYEALGWERDNVFYSYSRQLDQ